MTIGICLQVVGLNMVNLRGTSEIPRRQSLTAFVYPPRV